MALLSPGVQVTTNDLSQVTTAAGDSAACFCGDFTKGPVNVPTLISSVSELKEIFGSPTKANYNQWYQVYNFLQYSGSIYVVRAADLNGTPTQSSLYFNSMDFVPSNFETQVKNATIQNASDKTLDIVYKEGLDFGKFIRFNENPESYRVLSAEKTTTSIKNTAYVELTDLSVDIEVQEPEQSQTITYSYETEDGASVEVTGNASEVEIVNTEDTKTLKFLKSGVIAVTFTAHKDLQRDKVLEAQFEVKALAKPVQPTIDASEVLSGSKTEISIEHEDGTTIEASIPNNEDNSKGTINVK